MRLEWVWNMSDTAQNNGATGNHTNGRNGKRPPLMGKVKAAYWVDLPLEIIEHGCSRLFEEHWRVTFAIVRCSFLFTFQSLFAVRPRLRTGGFQGWIEAFHERVNQKRAIVPGTLNEEQADTDARGRLLAATFDDLAAILDIRTGNARRGVNTAIGKGLVLPGIPLYANPKPAVLPPTIERDPEKLSTEFILRANIAGIKLSPEFFPTDPKLRTRAMSWVSDLGTRWQSALSTVRTEYRKELRDGATEFSLLIPQRGRPKSKDPVRPYPSSREGRHSDGAGKNGRTDLLSMTEESLKGLAKEHPHCGPIDNPGAAAQSICEACDWNTEIVVAIFQGVVSTLKKGGTVKSIPGLLISRAMRYQQERASAAAAGA